jgi:hypothetical protein
MIPRRRRFARLPVDNPASVHRPSRAAAEPLHKANVRLSGQDPLSARRPHALLPLLLVLVMKKREMWSAADGGQTTIRTEEVATCA